MPGLSDAAKPSQDVFDVFRVEDPEGLQWCAAFSEKEKAIARANKLANSDGHDYVIIHYQTGDRKLIKPNTAQP